MLTTLPLAAANADRSPNVTRCVATRLTSITFRKPSGVNSLPSCRMIPAEFTVHERRDGREALCEIHYGLIVGHVKPDEVQPARPILVAIDGRATGNLLERFILDIAPNDLFYIYFN